MSFSTGKTEPGSSANDDPGAAGKLLDVDFDRPRLHFRALRHFQVQHAILRVRFDAAFVDILGQPERACEATITTLDAMYLTGRFLFVFAFAADGEHAVLECDLHVRRLHCRHFEIDLVILVRFADVDRRIPIAGRDVLAPAIEALVHEAVEELIEFPRRIPTYNAHVPNLHDLV